MEQMITLCKALEIGDSYEMAQVMILRDYEMETSRVVTQAEDTVS